MKTNRIRRDKKLKGGFISVDWEQVDRARACIDIALNTADVITIDALTALCIAAIEIAHNGGIEKPQMLLKLSNFWEEFDQQIILEKEKKKEKQND